MARVWADEASGDELPSVNELLRQKAALPTKNVKDDTQSQKADNSQVPPRDAIVRRRRLGQVADNPLLRPLGKNLEPSSQRGGSAVNLRSGAKREDVGGPRVELRARKPRTVTATVRDVEIDEEESEGETIVEEVTIVDDSVYFSLSSSDEYSFDDLSEPEPPAKPKPPRSGRGAKSGLGRDKEAPEDLSQNSSKQAPSEKSIRQAKGARKIPDPGLGSELTSSSTKSKNPGNAAKPKSSRGNDSQEAHENEKPSRSSNKPLSLAEDLAGSLSTLRLEPTPPAETQNPVSKRPETPPPSTPPKSRPNVLVSPSKKLPRIPMTPHGPSTDEFWSQEVTDEWNDKHSPRKLFGPSTSPAKAAARSPEKKEKGAAAKQREAKKSFEATRHETAEKFLRELDRIITKGKLEELAASTGGYQKFMSEHMRLIRQENPGSPQKEVMKLVAERWAKTTKKTTKTRGKAKPAETLDEDVDDVADGLVSLKLQDS
ncbi:HMG box-containing protein [Magnaporthiopsis poae ATCC 64411]|uniref:HMG box-containing protein n=1 Tax=Magnaporthiopsis poae (strain ATCC 64411 / 73-15) TaxID=644358 RepID=A0A0C4DWN8_MAGP6|nr:HMG box-containing protein [Magnaporthiopsis poae ATCC 64411]